MTLPDLNYQRRKCDNFLPWRWQNCKITSFFSKMGEIQLVPIERNYQFEDDGPNDTKYVDKDL